MRELTISVAPNRFSTDWMPREVEWFELVRQFKDCRRTKETVEQYKAMPKEKRADAKDVGGFVGGWVQGNRKAGAVKYRSLLTLDIDYAQPDTIQRVKDQFDLVGTAWLLYSTHSHTPERPRYRLVIPLDRDVSPEEYVPIARRVAADIGIDTFDDSTYEPHRLMYWPSAPRDGEYVYEHGGNDTGYYGEPLCAAEVLATYRDWRNFEEWPVSSRVSKALAHTGKKQEDPTTKGGVVGAFCRIYSISQAIAEFLPDVYEPNATKGRYTYLKGSTAGGLVVYDDKWAYSHHGTDPIGGREVNAFDLVRIHKYGELDGQSDEDAKVTQLPSFKAMEDWCGTLPKVKGELAVSNLSRRSAEEAFGEELPDEQWPSDPKELLRKLIEMDLVHTDRKGNVVCDPASMHSIMTYDPGLKGTVKYDEFADRALLTRDLPWKKLKSGDETWDDTEDKNLLLYMSKQFNLSGKQTIIDMHDVIIYESSYHPVRDYLNGLTWDGVERLDTMLIDYLGALDTPLTRTVTRKHMVAAVARVMHPGEKYEYALTLSGPEGIGKSTIIKKLGMKWYNNSFSSSDVGNKDSKEQIVGNWLIELGELVSIKKNTNEAFKAFLTTDTDKYRPAYGRKLGTFPRQCVFWATTNETYFLKGDTGNRRFWTVCVGKGDPVKDVFSMGQADIDQLWAEAVVRYQEGEKLFLDPEMNQLAIEQAEQANEISGDERIGIIEAFIAKKLPRSWWRLSRKERSDWFRDKTARVLYGEEEVEQRKYICAQEVANECFFKDMTRYEAKEINQILHLIDGLEYVDSIRISDVAYGGQRRFRITDRFWCNHATEAEVASRCEIAQTSNNATNENDEVAREVARIPS